MKRGYLILITIILAASGCYKDRENISTDYDPDPPSVEVISRMLGTAIDIDGLTVGGVDVEWQSQLKTSDKNGFVVFNKERYQLGHSAALVKHTDYYKTRHPILGVGGQCGLTSLPMIKHGLPIKNLTTGRVQLQVDEDLEIVVPSKNFRDESHQVHNGEYFIFAHQLDRLERDFMFSHMPLPIELVENMPKGIIVDKAYLIEFTKVDGESLEALDSFIVELSDDLVDSDQALFLQNEDGSFSSLESLDNATNRYELAHGGLLLIGHQIEVGLRSVILTLEDQTPVSYSPIRVNSNIFNTALEVRTTSNGVCRMWLPLDDVELEVLSQCGHVLADQSWSINQGSELTMKIQDDQFFIHEVSALDCDKEILKEGYLIYQGSQGVWILPFDEQGSINTFIPYCADESLTFSCFDYNENELIYEGEFITSLGYINSHIEGCSQELKSECIVTIDGDRLVYDMVIMDEPTGPSNFTPLNFYVSNATMDASHKYQKIEYNGSEFWSTSSKFFRAEYEVLNINSPPKISDFKDRNREYREVHFQDITFKHIVSQQSKRGDVYYLIQTK